MLKNYIKVAVRNLIRNKPYVFINVLGLSVAIAICVVIYLNYSHSVDSNREHENYRETFKVNGTWILNGDPEGVGIAPMPLTTMIKNDIGAIKDAVRYHVKGEVVKRGDDVFREDVAYVDDTFLEVFDFSLREGSKDAIKNPGQIIISRQMAIRFFNDEPALGKEIRILSNGKEFLYTVGGVLNELPTNSTFDLDAALISIETYFNHYPETERNNWAEWVDGVFVQLHNAADKELVEQQLAAYLPQQNDANEQMPYAGFYLDRIDEWAHNEKYLRYGNFRSGMASSALWGLNSSAILILLLSCFNFTNTSISFSNRRLKEIGIRKVFGGMRSQLITQFLIENLMLILTALVIGLVLAEMLVPAFNDLFWFVRLELDLLGNFKLLAFLIVLMLLVAAFSAIYPAIYVSSFKPVNIFQGNVKFGSGNMFLRVLIAGQFIITVYNIFASIVFYQNGKYQTTMDQGYDIHQSIVVPIDGERDFIKLKNNLSQNPEISSIAGSRTQIAFSTDFATFEHKENEQEVGWLQIGHDYLRTMGIDIVQGRDFEDGVDNYLSKKLIINEQLVKDLGWEYGEETVLGRRLFLDSAYYTVVGIARNFHEKLLFKGGDIRPAIITLTPPENFRYLTVRSESDLTRVNDKVKEQWAQVIPDIPYTGYYQSRAIEVVEDTNYIIDRVNWFVAVISIMLSAIGLYTLVSLNVIKRIKEIGIRKVLGASVLSIVQLLNRNFAGLLLIGAVLGSFSGYLVMDWLLDIIYAYRLPLNLWPLLFSVLLLVVVAATTVGAKVYNAAKVNPVDHLRNE